MAAAECMLVRSKQFDHMTRHCRQSRDSGLIERSARLSACQTYDCRLIWYSVRDEVTTNPIIWGGLGGRADQCRVATTAITTERKEAPPTHQHRALLAVMNGQLC